MNIDRDDLFCVKIVGTLDSYDRPVTVVLPKVKISRGFNLQFSETEYGGMPWEMQPLLMSATEATDRLADIGTGSFFDIYVGRSEEHTSELQSLMRISYAVFCLKKKKITRCIKHAK